MKITHIHARQILDSRGFPTVEADVTLEDGTFGRAAVPSGASTGAREALELRDNDPDIYAGKSVHRAVDAVHSQIAPKLMGMYATDQSVIDEAMRTLDGTKDKSRLGANAILSVSLATAHAAAKSQNMPLYQYIGELAGNTDYSLPRPMVNIINGGKHAAGSTDIQEFMIIPHGFQTMADRVRVATDIFHQLAKVLSSKSYATTVGDEGGYAPAFKNGNREALESIAQAVDAAGYRFGEDIGIALDVAASELFSDGIYHLSTEDRDMTADDLIAWYQQLQQLFPIQSIEDGLDENDWAGWTRMTNLMGDSMQIVGDDLLVTNTDLLQQGLDSKAANAILIKPNQIGSLSETIQAVQLAQSRGWGTIMSHRSGETEDTTIAHLAVGLNTGQIKTGSMSRSERLAKYNELLRIEEHLEA